MKRVLVAGGAGFIGSHLCKRLLENNSRVYCLDNLSSGTVDNVAQLIDNKNFTFIEHDITLPVCLDIDEIYNLACPASPVFYQKDPINTAKSSVIGTLNLLELAKKKQARFTQASTSEIYGDPLVHPQTEGYYGNVNPIGVRSCYDEGKRMAESFCMDYYRIGFISVPLKSGSVKY